MSFKKHILLFTSMIIVLLLYLWLNETSTRKVTPFSTSTIPRHLSCGPAALIKVSQAHGEKTTNQLCTLLRSDYKSKEAVTSFYDLANWSKAVGMKPIGLKIEATDLTEIPLPAIVNVNQNHFLALMATDKERVVVKGQGVLQYEIPRQNFDEQFSGYVLCFQ